MDAEPGNPARPWPRPTRPWVLPMGWHDLLFAHWPVPAAPLRERLPAGLELDTHEGRAWIGVVPFRMTGIRPRGLPPVPGVSAFAELNVRTYVVADGKPGVWFFSLDAASRIAVRVARGVFGLPYFDAAMECRAEGESVDYASERTHAGAPAARFRGRYGPTGPVFHSAPGSLEEWLTERYCLYGAGHRGVFRMEIDHVRWPLQPARARFDVVEMTALAGVELPSCDPHLLFARRLDVVAWTRERAGEGARGTG